jgi:hypothetical protein
MFVFFPYLLWSDRPGNKRPPSCQFAAKSPCQDFAGAKHRRLCAAALPMIGVNGKFFFLPALVPDDSVWIVFPLFSLIINMKKTPLRAPFYDSNFSCSLTTAPPSARRRR